ncbi:uroporphyrinogen-III C-methyltransferase [Aliikangiella maris]|uniref:Uroporphyrinogen-III C-methyltransferase n=2 Tax=Aliikangiella maris TaxID=3162458 RepID=A0ABV3MN57_9GAMM
MNDDKNNRNDKKPDSKNGNSKSSDKSRKNVSSITLPESSDSPATTTTVKPTQSNQSNVTAKPNTSSDSKASIQASSRESSQERAESATKSTTPSNSQTTTTQSKNSLFSAKPVPKMTTSRQSTRRVKLLPVAAIILSLLALLGIAWSAYQQYFVQQQWDDMQSHVKQQLDLQLQSTQQSRLTAQKSARQATSNQRLIQQQAQLITQLTESLTATQEKIRELSGRRQQDWLLAEAEYFIKLAEHKITLEKDKSTAIALLKTADDKIKQIGDNRLLELRQQLADDIANLQLIIAPDFTGIAAQLDAISDKIPELAITALEYAPIKDKLSPSQPTVESDFSWQKLYDKIKHDFIEIKEHGQPVIPLMTPKQRANLNANIQLALQQAQIYMLRGEQKLYEQHLQNAQQWIKTYFVDSPTAPSENLSISQLLDTLSQLQQTPINIDLPRALSSRQTIQNINQSRLYQWLEQNGVNTSIKANTSTTLPDTNIQNADEKQTTQPKTAPENSAQTAEQTLTQEQQ